jgi:hypothetical protein
MCAPVAASPRKNGATRTPSACQYIEMDWHMRVWWFEPARSFAFRELRDV